jgi:hypothetical protein
VPSGREDGIQRAKLAWWRVYGTAASTTSAGRPDRSPVTSLISWLGQWYVVHLGAIR